MLAAEPEVQGVDAHVESVFDDEKALVTAYKRDERTNSHHKSPMERKLVLKADLVIVPLAALIYFVAYLVKSVHNFVR